MKRTGFKKKVYDPKMSTGDSTGEQTSTGVNRGSFSFKKAKGFKPKKQPVTGFKQKKVVGLAKVSERQKKINVIYRRRSIIFRLKFPDCEACQRIHEHKYGQMIEFKGPKRAQSTHHMMGREGGNMLNEETWLSICELPCHNWIHNHPKEAEELKVYRCTRAEGGFEPVRPIP